MTIQERIDVLRSHGMSRDATAAILGITPAEVAAVSRDPESPVSVESGSASNADAPIPATLVGTTDDTPLEHTWAAGDIASAESAFPTGWLAHYEQWTATASGTVQLLPPEYDGSTSLDSRVEFRIYEGAITEIPDREGTRQEPDYIGRSYWDVYDVDGSHDDEPGEAEVVADTTYTLVVLNKEGLTAVDRVVSLREWALSIAPFGGAPQLFTWRDPSGLLSRAEGYDTVASGDQAHAEGHNTRALGIWSHAEGNETTADGIGAHAEGCGGQATNLGAHAEGYDNVASGYASHAEGGDNVASRAYAHAEGQNTSARGIGAHSEGQGTLALGDASHAEGRGSYARAPYSHARGSDGYFGTDQLGTSQYMSVEMQGVTNTDAVLQPLSYPGVPCEGNRVIGIRGMVAARSTDGLLGATWTFVAAGKTDALGAWTMIGTPSVSNKADAGASTWDIDIAGVDADGVNPIGPATPNWAYLQVLVTGAADTEIHWSITLEMKEVG